MTASQGAVVEAVSWWLRYVTLDRQLGAEVQDYATGPQEWNPWVPDHAERVREHTFGGGGCG